MLALERLRGLKPHPAAHAALWGIGIFMNGMLLSFLLNTALPSGAMAGDAKAALIADTSLAWLALVALGFAPWVETTLAQWLPIEAMRSVKMPRPVMVLICGLVFGGGHYLSNGLNHGVKTFVDGVLLGELYLRLRHHSALRSWLTVTAAHFVNNLCALALMLAMR